MIIRQQKLVTTQVLYFIPRTHILQEFIWQVSDTVPDLPRVRRFLDYWHREIDAIISKVLVMTETDCDWRQIAIEINTRH